MINNIVRFSCLLISAIALNACAAGSRIAEIGQPPAMSPTAFPAQGGNGERRVSVPLPNTQASTTNANSLWRPGARSFFKDQRARTSGDIVTVVIDIDDSARLDNTTERTRDNGESAAIPAFGGFEQKLADLLPDGANPSQLVDLSSDSTVRGDGSVDRREDVELTVAAIVTNVLPNGNLVIAGKQEVRVNFEVRELLVTGIIRPEDISNANRIPHTS